MILAALILIAGVGLFAFLTWRARRETAVIEAEEAKMEIEMAHDAVDDGFAHDVARARDKGV